MDKSRTSERKDRGVKLKKGKLFNLQILPRVRKKGGNVKVAERMNVSEVNCGDKKGENEESSLMGEEGKMEKMADDVTVEISENIIKKIETKERKVTDTPLERTC